MIDSHTHLDRLAEPAAEAVATARQLGVTKILTIGMGADGSREALALADAHPEVWASVGHHPNSAADFDEAGLEALRDLAVHPRCVAIGETGLDHFRDHAPAADQARAFHAQIDLARETGKPLVVHTRAAEEETISTLRERADGVSVILHCFSMPAFIDDCLGQDAWVFSFAGNVTYPKAEDLAEAAELVPLDRLLVETDAPYLSPVPERGKKNVPANVVHTAQFVAERRGIPYAELEAAVEANAARVLGW